MIQNSKLMIKMPKIKINDYNKCTKESPKIKYKILMALITRQYQ